MPSTVEPSLKTTSPEGAPTAGATTATRAVSVTDWPETEGLSDEARESVVPPRFTTWASEGAVLPSKRASPL